MEILGSFNFARFIFLRLLAAIYFVAFLVAFNQFPGLLGDHGLLPVSQFIKQVPFHAAPSLFYLGYSDLFLRVLSVLGMSLSAGLLLGFFDRGPWGLTTILWLILWVFYLSIVNVGQVFYSFGWESMLLEAGFFAAFLGPRLAPSIIPILILRWMLFRTEFGAGLIKIRGDACWRDFTCLYYHHETQPMPNPLSWYFHHLPKEIHRAGVWFSHFVQLVVPFGLFAPSLIAAISGALIIFHQAMLIASGNYSWLNWLTVALGMTTFSDSILKCFLPWKIPKAAPRPVLFNGILYALAALTLLLSIQPTLNFFSKRQAMNANYNPFHLVGSYGAFGSVTKDRYEIVAEGASEDSPDTAHWKEYAFKGKPGDIHKVPPQFAPYHLRLDWLMWFLPFQMSVADHQVYTQGYPLWFLRLAKKLLENDKTTLSLLASNPFPETAPHLLRAEVYLFHFTDAAERKKTGAVWKRERMGDFLPPINLQNLKNIDSL